MRRRPGCIFLLLFQVLWLNVVLPGHTRGMIALPGSGGGASAQTKAGCCNKHHEKDQVPVKSRTGTCAVCFFAARLSLPDVIDLTPPALGLVDIVDIEGAQGVYFPQVAIPFDHRGPPHV